MSLFTKKDAILQYDKIINNVRIVSNHICYISQKTMYNAAFVIEV